MPNTPTTLEEALKVIDKQARRIDDLEESLAEAEGDADAFESQLDAVMQEAEDRQPLVAEVMEMPSLDRDRFLSDLCRECALLGIEWPTKGSP